MGEWLGPGMVGRIPGLGPLATGILKVGLWPLGWGGPTGPPGGPAPGPELFVPASCSKPKLCKALCMLISDGAELLVDVFTWGPGPVGPFPGERMKGAAEPGMAFLPACPGPVGPFCWTRGRFPWFWLPALGSPGPGLGPVAGPPAPRLWSFGVLSGRQTGQSVLEQFFQWQIICLEDEQWGSGQVLPAWQDVIWVRTFFIVRQCGRLHWK